jgi:hypothetical protein
MANRERSPDIYLNILPLLLDGTPRSVMRRYAPSFLLIALLPVMQDRVFASHALI